MSGGIADLQGRGGHRPQSPGPPRPGADGRRENARWTAQPPRPGAVYPPPEFGGLSCAPAARRGPAECVCDPPLEKRGDARSGRREAVAQEAWRGGGQGARAGRAAGAPEARRARPGSKGFSASDASVTWERTEDGARHLPLASPRQLTRRSLSVHQKYLRFSSSPENMCVDFREREGERGKERRGERNIDQSPPARSETEPATQARALTGWNPNPLGHRDGAPARGAARWAQKPPF